MKKIKFQWADVICVKKGRDPDLCSQMSVAESFEERFLHISILRRGVVNLMFSSKDLRNSCVQAFELLCSQRRDAGSSTLS